MTDRTGAQPKPNNDPAYAMTQLWQREYDELNRLCSAASNRERAMFDASPSDKQDAECAYLIACRARDRLADKLETMMRGIEKTKAQSLQGISGKIATAILQNAPEPTSPEPPWPMLRSCVDDLERLAAQPSIANDHSDGTTTRSKKAGA